MSWQKNSAFLFIKPHALNDKVKALLRGTLAQKGITVLTEGRIDAAEIDKNSLIDKHYYAIASKATLLTPDQLNVPKEKFQDGFGISWEAALQPGRVLNAKDACEKMNVGADGLGTYWNMAKDRKQLVKLGGGFYCAKIELKDKGDFYVFNGFFMAMRDKFVVPGAAIYYYVLEWDPLLLSWADFRGQVLGPTDPATAPVVSLRGMIYSQWQELGLSQPPNTGDNAVHASASPFEGLCERMNWLGALADQDPFGQLLLKSGVSEKQIQEWSLDPQVTYGKDRITGSLWDVLEDTDVDRCVSKCQMLASICSAKTAKNIALIFIKPHALTDKVKTLVQNALRAKGLCIRQEAQIDGSTIDKDMLIDKHYYSIASKATLVTPDQLNVPKDKFEKKFGFAWDDALKAGKALNAKEACSYFNVDAEVLGKMWNEAKAADQLVKLGGGFYCAKMGSSESGSVYVFNGFFMSMRGKFVAPGAAIYYYVVEWDPLDLSWSDFRSQLLGATDPTKAPADSIRGAILSSWKDLGLSSEPNTGDNGVHASASPFEGLAERLNWLGISPETDAYGQQLLCAGIPRTQIERWSTDPQVTYGPNSITGSLFDALEDMDADDCTRTCQMIAGVGRFEKVLKNRAFVFIKPHAMTDKVRTLVRATLQDRGLSVICEKQIDGAVIDKDMLIDKHYYSIASKATLLTPDKLNVPQDKFKKKFGLEWEAVIKTGAAVNARDACERLGVDAEGLSKLWNEAKTADQLIKFGGGFYCAKIQGADAGSLYVFNGFFMSMRNKFVASGAAIYYYVVEWDPLDLSWSDFRSKVLGPTDPAKAPLDSLRGMLYCNWANFGLSAEPNTGDNGVHASASPFEGLAERMNWLGCNVGDDVFGRQLLEAGVKRQLIEEWALDPQVSDGFGAYAGVGSLFDALEDLDADKCLRKCQKLAGVGDFAPTVKNHAFVFIKPHAMNDKVKALAQGTLTSKGLRILKEGQIDGSVIDQMKLIDKHYYAIASKATLQKPHELNVPKEKFKDKFGLEWDSQIALGTVLNAKDACAKLGLDAKGLGAVWNEAAKLNDLVKFGGGFYCAKITFGGQTLYVLNGFFMEMRDKFCAVGAAIYYYYVEWDVLQLSWSEFRSQILGPTDPSKAPPTSLRGLLYTKYADYGLAFQPNTGDNGMHASASPFEGLVERMNWLGLSSDIDAYGRLLLRSGIPREQIEEWSVDPQVTYGPDRKTGSIFDALEDQDADRCITTCQMIAGKAATFDSILKNQAFVFIKPHAVTDKVKSLVSSTLQARGLTIVKEMQIDGSIIDKDMLIDRHYYAIASKATLVTPDKLNVPKDKFKQQFGIEWGDALKSGKAVNAKGACAKLGVDADTLGKMWNEAKAANKLVKLGGGFYCGDIQGYYVFNGFFMSMRNKFVAPGAAIYYYVVEWDPLLLSWADFRGKVLGPTDPAKAPADSLRGILFTRWKELGLSSEPNTGDNGVHASASPFEALAERMNWLGYRPDTDIFGRMLLEAGVSTVDIEEWTKDPRVSYPTGDQGSLWDYLEDADSDRCLLMCQAIGRLGQNLKSAKNRAFVFIKPHALTESVKTFVRDTLQTNGISIEREAQLDGSVIDKLQLIDKHYYAIASKATLQTPDKLNVPQDKFKSKFGIEWKDALATGKAVNAKDACAKLGVDAVNLGDLWAEAKSNDQLIKFGGGFYCGKIRSYYVINGFFMSMRNKFVAPGAAIYYFVVEWDPLELPWSDFRGQVLGPTDPAKAPKDSIRGTLFTRWQDLGLKGEPNTGDNGVHASASPFEALVERMNWLNHGVDADAFGQQLLQAGVASNLVEEWSRDPQVFCSDGPLAEPISLFDALEDTDIDRCLALCQKIARVGRFVSTVKNQAFVFIKPHAVNDQVVALVKDTFRSKGIIIVKEGRIDGATIDEKQLIDKHYYAIASKATLLPPEKLNVPSQKFKDKFGLAWDDVLKSGKAVNAVQACARLGVDASGLATLWNDAKKADKLVKLGGGFYCGLLGEYFVFNGFFMEMRSEFVAPGAAIHYFHVEWDPMSLAWSDFRGQILGPTDPAKAPPESLRGSLFKDWKGYGLSSEPNTGDNGIHASASPFEGLAERMNWLSSRAENDPFGCLLLKAGIRKDVIDEWSKDPQVAHGPEHDPKVGSLWDALEDSDANRCLEMCKQIAGVGEYAKPAKNLAFVFIKPHALTDSVKMLVQKTLQAKGLRIKREAQIDGSVIDEQMLIDKHYYAIASKATLQTPDKLNVPQEKFKSKFGLEWADALTSGSAVNAKDACQRLGVDASSLGELWNQAKSKDQLIKFGGGFYCGKIEAAGKGPYYVINGFFMSMRGKFVAPGAAIYYFVVEWDPLELPWSDFRGKVLGPTDPAKAPPDSLRGLLFTKWKEYGLKSEPNTGDNGVHASASPFEGLVERMNWLGCSVDSDPFGRHLLRSGATDALIGDWSKDPQVKYGPEPDATSGSLWDALEDSDADRCILMCQKIASVTGRQESSGPPSKVATAAVPVAADLTIMANLAPSACRIRLVHAREIYDSCGNPTVEVDIVTDLGLFRAAVPSGVSKGAYEALELRDGNKTDRFGKGCIKAISNINQIIGPKLVGMDVTAQRAIDDLMVKELDGQQNGWGWSKSKLGANAILAVSMAVCRAGAEASEHMLFHYISRLAKRPPGKFVLPVPAFNVINGGCQAGNRLALQEFMILPVGANSFSEAMSMGSEIYHLLKKVIKRRYGADACNVGDEGGFTPNFQDNEEALSVLIEAIEQSGHAGKIKIATDVAASEFYNGSSKLYDLDFKNPMGSAPDKKKTAEQLVSMYQTWFEKYPFVSIEDPFDQDDLDAYKRFMAVCGKDMQVVGDDLLVTNPRRIQKALDAGACNALLLKVNQIGSVTEAIEAAMMAQNAGWGVIVSHRSGETEDTFISDLAVGLRTGQIKSGAPCRSERLAKYNELLRIEQELGDELCVYAGANFRNP